MFAAVVVPLFGVFYSGSTPSPRAAFVSVLSGMVVRIVLEFSIPKDKSYLLPYGDDEFLNYGPAASASFPVFFDEEDVWDPVAEPCQQETWKDYIGVDSLSAFFAGLISFVAVAMIERCTGKPLFTFPGLEPYEKDLGGHKDETEKTKKQVAGEDSSDDKKDSNESGDVVEEEEA